MKFTTSQQQLCAVSNKTAATPSKLYTSSSLFLMAVYCVCLPTGCLVTAALRQKKSAVTNQTVADKQVLWVPARLHPTTQPYPSCFTAIVHSLVQRCSSGYKIKANRRARKLQNTYLGYKRKRTLRYNSRFFNPPNIFSNTTDTSRTRLPPTRETQNHQNQLFRLRADRQPSRRTPAQLQKKQHCPKQNKTK